MRKFILWSLTTCWLAFAGAMAGAPVPPYLYVACGGLNQYDGFTGSLIATNPYTADVGAVAIGPNGDPFVTNGSRYVVEFNRVTDTPIGGVAQTGQQYDWFNFGPDGNLYVVNLIAAEQSADITEYNGATGAFVGTFVPALSGGLGEPTGGTPITFGPDGNLYVSNTYYPGPDGNNPDGANYGQQVLEFNGTTGAFIQTFVNSGATNPAGPLELPQGLTFGPDGNLYVVSGKVLKFNGTTGAYMGVFASPGANTRITDLQFGPNGNLYVASIGGYETNGGVLEFNGATGAYLTSITMPPNAYCEDLAFTPGLGTDSVLMPSAGGSSSVELTYPLGWTATSNNSFLHISAGSASGYGKAIVAFTVDPFTGTGTRVGTLTIAGLTVTVTQVGVNYVGPGGINGLGNPGTVTGLAVDGSANVYFIDAAGYIEVWNLANPGGVQPVLTFSCAGASSPTALAVDASGNVYLADPGNNTIEECSAATQQATALVSSGLNGPQGIAVDSAANVYFADTGNNAVKEWSPITQQVTTLISSGLSGPGGVAVDYLGNVYIEDTNNEAIKEWSPVTQQVTTLASTGTQFPYASGLAVDGSGNVYFLNLDSASGYYAAAEWVAATQQVTILADLNPLASYVAGIGAGVDPSGNVYIGTVQNTWQSTASLNVILNAYAGPPSLTEPSFGGSDSISVIPAAALHGVVGYDNPWLTVTGLTGGVVTFAFVTNPYDVSRNTKLFAVGQYITITQEASSAVYTDLGNSASFSSNDWCVTGTSNANCSNLAIAAPFTVAASSTLSTIALALSNASGTNGAIISLTNSAVGGSGPLCSASQTSCPGTVLESWTVSNLPSSSQPTIPPTIVVSQLTPALQAGQTYWIEVQPLASDTTDYWYANDVGLGGGEANVSNAGWTTLSGFSGQTLPAFAINEPLEESPQTISFAPLSNEALGGSPFTVTATASSGLAVSFVSNTTGVCTVSGETVTVLALGTCSITASQAGSNAYLPAANVTQSFTVESPVAPAIITSISPNSAVAGAPAFTLTLNGAQFTNKSVVLFNGAPLQTTFVGSSQITANVTSALLNAAGTVTVSVGASNAPPFHVLAPVITSVSPISTPADNASLQLTVTGTGFFKGVSTIYFNGQALTTTFVSSTQLSATVPANLTSSSVPVTVVNLTTSSNEQIFTVGAAPFACAAQTGTPLSLRIGGETELLGDFVILCSPGAPGGTVSQDVTVQASNFNFTSRILNSATGATEALLLVGDPAPAAQVLNSNVFQGFLEGPDIVFPGVQLDTSAATTVRIVNLRANTLPFAVGVSQPQSASVSVSMGPIALSNAVQTLGYVLPTNFKAATVYSGGTTRSVEVTFTELFADAFRPRVAPGGVQDVPGMDYFTESGFVNPALLPGAGLADYGTRLLLQLTGVPAGVDVYADVTSDDGVSASLVVADDTGAGGEGSFVAGTSMFGGTYAPVAISNGTGTATWEVVSANPSAVTPLSFHVVLTGVTETGLGPVVLEGSVAPLNPVSLATATDPVPRFASGLLTGFINMTLNSASAAQSSVSQAPAAADRLAGKAAGAASTGTPLPPPIQSGSSVTVNYNLVNNSPAPTTQIAVSSTVSGSLTVDSCSAPGGTCKSTANPDGTTSVTAVYPGPVQSGAAASFSFTGTACTSTASSCLNSTGIVSTTVMGLNANQQFVEDSFPDDNSSSNTYTITSHASTAPQVAMILATNPPNLEVQIGSGKAQAANPTVSTTISQSGTLNFSAVTPQPGPNGSQYVFSHWSDGSTSASRTAVPAPIGGGTFTAYFVPGYPLNVTATKGGSVTLSPAGGYFPADAVVEITAKASPGYQFSELSGGAVGNTNPFSLVMPQQAVNIQANFSNTPQKITFGPIGNQTLGTPPFVLTAIASSGLPVVFASNSPAVCTVFTATVTLLAAGTCSITASQAGNATYEPAPSVTEKFSIQATQTITFGTLSSHALGTGTVTLTATASSGLVVSYKSNNTKVCTVSGAKVTLVEAGTCSITASQTGNAVYVAATPVTQTFSVVGEAQTINFPDPPMAHTSAKTVTLTATASSKLTVSFGSNTMETCTVSGAKVTLLSAGMCSITASQDGNATWAEASPVTQEFTIVNP